MVKDVTNLKLSDDKGVYESCQYGKAHRLSFDRSSLKSKAPLERIHSDMYEKIRSASYYGFHYMLVLIDDFTRFTWVYFVKNKLDILAKFQEFKEIVENLFKKKVLMLKVDNGDECL